jgi:hypothetical protein
VSGDDQRGRLIDDGDSLGIRDRDLFGGLDEGAAVVAVFLRIGFDFGGDAGAQRFFGTQQLVQAFGFFAQFGQFFTDLDAFQPRQLTQADFEDVFGLNRGQLEVRHQIGLGVVRFADDLDDLVDVEQDGLPAFEDVNALFGAVRRWRVRRVTVASRKRHHSAIML